MNTSKVVKDRIQVKKDDNKKKKKKILLAILLALGLLGTTGGGIGIGYVIWGGRTTGNTPPPFATGIEISDGMKNDSRYIVPADESIYYSDTGTYHFGHPLLNLKALSEDNHNETFFTILGYVDFGFLVDPDMDCHINGIKANAVCYSDVDGQWSTGVVVGRTNVTPGQNWDYKGNLQIDDNVEFTVSSNADAKAYGVHFNNIAANSTQTINGMFNINSYYDSGTPYVSGVCFDGNIAANSTQTINGMFRVFSNNYSSGVEFNGTCASNVTINGIFNVSSINSNKEVDGVYFGYPVTGNITINGEFVISSNRCVIGVTFYDDVNSYITINGTFNITNATSATYNMDTIGVNFAKYVLDNSFINIDGTFTINSTHRIYGVLFNQTTIGSTKIINGTFTINSSGADTTDCTGFFCTRLRGNTTINGTFTIINSSAEAYVITIQNANDNFTLNVNGVFTSFTRNESAACGSCKFLGDNEGTLNMSTAKFFSNKEDSGNVFTKYPNDQLISYEWNGQAMKYDSHASQGDDELETRLITDNSHNFSIQVIDTTMGTNKQTFNNRYKLALQTYVDSGDCPSVAKPWLRNIISKIDSI